MARTNSRKISRRGLKKKSPLPAVALILWVAGICMAFVYLHMNSRTLNYELEGRQTEVADTQNRIRNLTAEVEKLTGRRFILRKVTQFNLGLREPIPGQVHHVRHIESVDSLPAQRLRDDLPATVASRR
ncbi:MAG: hypothetical protein NE330_23945 [Lentisphaeraceae bacterium]|nr:hypothetical protein [Lentisphaeraceae bacterium]